MVLQRAKKIFKIKCQRKVLQYIKNSFKSFVQNGVFFFKLINIFISIGLPNQARLMTKVYFFSSLYFHPILILNNIFKKSIIKNGYLLASWFITGVKWRVTATIATHSKKITVAMTPMTTLALFRCFCSSLREKNMYQIGRLISENYV